jgi:penicillin-binding protein 1A
MIKLFRFLFVVTVIAAIAGSAFIALTLYYFGRNLPAYKQLANYQPAIVTRVEAGDGRLLAEYATERRLFVPIRAIPKRVIEAFLAAEDKDFYQEPGFDPLAILRAAIVDIGRLAAHRRPEGASTITQQVAKNMLLNNKLSIARKIREILLANRLEHVLSKNRILELYLNQIYLGSGAYGVAEAALTYFDKSLDQLSLSEAAVLAGLPKAPSRYDPKRHPRAARARRNWVLARMVADGDVTPQEAAKAEAQPITPRRREAAEVADAPYFAEEVRRELIARYGRTMVYEGGLSVRTSLDPRLQRAADSALRKGLIAYDKLHGGWRGAIVHLPPQGDWARRLAKVLVPAVAKDVGWRIALVRQTGAEGAQIGFADRTGGEIPFSEMRWARRWHQDGGLGPAPRSAADVLRPGDVVMVAPLASPAGGKADPPLFTLCQVPAVSGALVAMDPHTGRILALSGGFSFAISQFDRATQAMRQTGSAIKPFVYLTALRRGFTPSTLVLDAPISIDQGPGLPPWTPGDYEPYYRGPTPLRIGLEQSLNTLTARVAEIVGLDAVAHTVERFGIMAHMPREYSMVIGAGETTPLRLTTAYAMLDNGGRRVTPTLIDRIQDRNGATIFRADERPCDGCGGIAWKGQPPPAIPDDREQIADPLSVYQVVSMMRGVVERGTGTAVRAVGRPIAGKTGTTNDFRDAWFLGFTPDLVAGVFVGYDDPRSLGHGEAGGVLAAPIFRDFMIEALKGTPARAFPTPPAIELYRVDPATGLPPAPGAAAIYEPFKPGTNPSTNRQFALRWTPGESTPIEAPLEEGGASSGSEAPQSGTGGLY